MAYRWIEHTGELELELDADTEGGVFEECVAAMRELLEERSAVGESGGDGPGEPAPPRRVVLEARDRATLLADWLAELAFLAESERLVPQRVASLTLDGNRLEAVIEGHRGDPPHLVKAVTYHRLSLQSTPGGVWRATAVLDV